MAIDPNTKSMLDPTRNGDNFGISASFSYQNSGNYATNRQEVARAVGNSSNIDKLVGKVSYAGANQAQLPDLQNLGVPLGQDGRAN